MLTAKTSGELLNAFYVEGFDAAVDLLMQDERFVEFTVALVERHQLAGPLSQEIQKSAARSMFADEIFVIEAARSIASVAAQLAKEEGIGPVEIRKTIKKYNDERGINLKEVHNARNTRVTPGGPTAFESARLVGKSTPEGEQGADTETPIERVTRESLPAIVTIYTKSEIPESENQSLESYFGFKPVKAESSEDAPKEGPHKQSALGSGVFIDPDGYILTNAHVAATGGKSSSYVISLLLPNGEEEEVEARLVMSDPSVDIAVLHIDRTNCHALSMEKPSKPVKVGNQIVALGNPFGVGRTATFGGVSGLDRADVGISEEKIPFIQVDAPINPGNSGGALVRVSTDEEGNPHGELIGINTAIFSRSGGSVGIGFAIPIEHIKDRVESAIAFDKAFRALKPKGK